jgi:hypothetical protein
LRRYAYLPAALVAVSLLAAPVFAVKPGTWTHHTEAEFSTGKAQGTIITNLGEVQLSRATQKLAELAGDDSVIYDIARVGEKVVVSMGPEGKLARLDGEKLETFAEDATAQIFALAADKAGLWVACSGSPSRIDLRSGDDLKVTRSIPLPDVRYIWAIVPDGKRLWVATGTSGKVLVIDTDEKEPKPVVALDCKQSNILCLGLDAKGRAYAGTDGDGLIYRITPDGNKFTSFVLFDAPEPEIGALMVMENGTVYAGTADAEQARPGRLEAARAESKGRPEKPTQPVGEPKLPNVPPRPEPKAGDKPEPSKPDAAKPEAPKPEAAKPAEPEKEKPAEPAVAAGNGQPTREQYDQLREAIHAKLEQAAKNGPITLQQGPGTGGPSALPSGPRPRLTPSRALGGAAGGKQGNAIYRINPEGFVKEVFRESVMVLRIVRSGDALFVATGNEGLIFRIDPDGEEVTRIADLEPKQIPALLSLPGGDVLVGTANPGRLFRMADTYAAEATLTSAALDAKQISLFGKFQVTAHTPEGTSVDVQTRSGNVADPEAGSWSEWSKTQTVTLAADHSHYLDTLSPAARFLQYRLTLHSKGKATPSVAEVSLKYLMPNLEPRIASVKADYPKARPAGLGAAPAAADSAQRSLKIDWEATDPNEDKLVYKLEARPFDSDGPWVTLADKLDANTYDWNTRTAPDGRYILRVTASDSPDNIPDQALSATRRSDPVTVDNTPPSIEKLTVKPAGDGTIEVNAQVTDALSPIADVRYSISGKDKEEWKMVLPVDLIYDSTDELISVKISGLAPGSAVLTLRATDALGNTRYLAQPFELKK